MYKYICAKQNRAPRLMVGESAAHAFGGYSGVTNRFPSSFYFAFQLGVLAQMGVAAVARRAFVTYVCVSR